MPITYQIIDTGQSTVFASEIIRLIGQELGPVRVQDVATGIDQKQLGFVIALDQNRLVGTGSFGRLLMHRDSWFLAFNAVDPDYRRKGIASKITQMRTDYLEKNCSAKLIWVSSRDYWTRMERHGFEFKFKLDQGTDNHGVMLKEINESI